MQTHHPSSVDIRMLLKRMHSYHMMLKGEYSSRSTHICCD